jgi:hypothetical protein
MVEQSSRPRKTQCSSATRLPFKVLPICSLAWRPAPAISLSTWNNAIFCSPHSHILSHKGRGSAPPLLKRLGSTPQQLKSRRCDYQRCRRRLSSFSPCGRRWRDANTVSSATDEGSASAERDPSPAVVHHPVAQAGSPRRVMLMAPGTAP